MQLAPPSSYWLTCRTGEKVVKFGQQINICVNVQLVHDHVIAMTVDGVIRVFSILKRAMVSQYKLYDLHRGDVEMKAGVQDVSGGVGGTGTSKWSEGQGRDMIVSLWR